MPEHRSKRPPHDRDESVLGASRDIPLGGEGATDAVADHTPDDFKKAREQEPLLGEGNDIPLGGEGPTDAVADHTPAHLRKAREGKPLLDD